MVPPEPDDGLEEGSALVAADSIPNSISDISALAALTGHTLEAFDDVLGEEEIHAHTHAYSMAHTCTWVNARLDLGLQAR